MQILLSQVTLGDAIARVTVNLAQAQPAIARATTATAIAVPYRPALAPGALDDRLIRDALTLAAA
ncbi:hypothetical protein [Pandoraea thiooxydans]|uniref:hypothetical protein n=1 Tax=Pandoraea thiooxydans TaxID=445709 RepID=UPI0006404DAA|nr:hypothetical protein [Pandoraea thiooxydans]